MCGLAVITIMRISKSKASLLFGHHFNSNNRSASLPGSGPLNARYECELVFSSSFLTKREPSQVSASASRLEPITTHFTAFTHSRRSYYARPKPIIYVKQAIIGSYSVPQ
jgi:hypothetical protein